MVNYSNGKVYKIEPIIEMLDEGDIYIGSTCKIYLSQRMDSHRQKYRKWNGTGPIYAYYSSYDLFDKYGIENCKITLLEVCSCNSKHELKARESHYIRTMKCVNKNIPNRTKKDWVADNKEYLINYRKNYRIANIEKEKDWVADNKEYLINYRKNYRIANIEHMTMLFKITYDCECGKNSQVCGKRRHERSNKHLKFVAEKKAAEDMLTVYE
jgi:hypothetical protein